RYAVKKSNVSSTAAAAKSDDKPVRALAARLSAERENEPLTGIDPQNAATIFASPCPINSWFSFHGARVLTAITLQLDIASMKLITATTSAAGSSARVDSQLT